MNEITRLPQQFTGPFQNVRRVNSRWLNQPLVQQLIATHREDVQLLAQFYELLCGPRPPPEYDPHTSDLPPPSILVMERYFTEKKLRKLLEKRGMEEVLRRRYLFSLIMIKLKDIKR